VYAPAQDPPDAAPGVTDAALPTVDGPVPDAQVPPEASVDAAPPVDAADAGEPRLRVFVTTASYKGSDIGQGAGGAVPEADRLCAMQARDLRLTGMFRAWLNTPASLARDRITVAGPWYDATGRQLVFARNPRTAQPPAQAIPQPDGTAPPLTWYAWTGADSSGGLRATCTSWTNGLEPGRFGRPATPATWADDNEQPCGEFMAHLYCFEVP